MISSWIKDWSYDASTGNLDIETKAGATYTYGDVPESVATDFSDADSLGEFHNTSLRGQYDYVRN